MQVKKKEVWKPIHIKEVSGRYQVSSHGRIKSLPKLKRTPYGTTYLSLEKIMKQSCTKNKYLNVTLSNKPYNVSHFVHILVAALFCDNPNRYGFVNHEDGNKQNNCYENLKWCDRSYNMLHAFSTGLIPLTRKKKNLT